jgi:opacity protein-like surface antigen
LTGDGHYSVGGGLIGGTLEYLHADFGSLQLFDIVPKIPETVDLRIDSVRVGLNYRFDASALHLH